MEFAIYGAGGFGREVKGLIHDVHGSTESLRCFVDDHRAEPGAKVQGVPVLGLDEAKARFPAARMVIAVGHTRVRATLAKKAADAGWRFTTLVHPSVIKGYNVEIGEGTIITAQCLMTTDIVIGAHVIFNVACSIGHDSVVEDFVTLAPSCRIAGNVRICRYSFLAQGVATTQGTSEKPIVIGENCTIGLNATITESLEPRTIVTTAHTLVRHKTP